MNKSFIYSASIISTILIIFPVIVLSARSHETCEYNFDCYSCVNSTGDCMWTVQSDEDADDDELVTMNLMDHSFKSHSFFECKSKSGSFNVNNTAHIIRSLYSKTTSDDFCEEVNKENVCSHPSRNTLETCVDGNVHAYANLGCAWDIQWNICVNKASDKHHPDPSRFRYTLQAQPSGTSNLYNLLGALIIVVSAFILSCFFYQCSSKNSVKVRFPVIDYEVRLHEAKHRQNARVRATELNRESKTDIIASNI